MHIHIYIYIWASKFISGIHPKHNYFFRWILPRSSALLPHFFRNAGNLHFCSIHELMNDSWEDSWIHEFHFRGVFRTSSADLPRCWPNNNNSWRIHEFMNLTSAESSAHLPRCWPNNNFAPWSNESLLSFTVNKSMNDSWTSSAEFFRSLPPIFRGSSAVLANWYVSKWSSNNKCNHQRFTLSGLNFVRHIIYIHIYIYIYK